MKLQQILSLVRRAVDDYKMIEKGDRIAVGVSGGKDSLALLLALKNLQRFYPNDFELIAVTVDLGFKNQNFDLIRNFCEDLDVPFHKIDTQIGEIVFEARKESNPCSLCAKMRKGALNYYVKDLGFNKVAFAHHKDDVIETMMLSLIYEGRFHTFCPVTELKEMGISLIRPFIYVNEKDIVSLANKEKLPVAKSACPVDGHTKREYVKNLLKDINYQNKGTKNRIFTAIKDSSLEGWDINGKE